jgi:sugar phosphate permease
VGSGFWNARFWRLNFSSWARGGQVGPGETRQDGRPEEPMSVQEAAATPAGAVEIGGVRWLVLALIFIVYTAAYADRANIGIALPYIKAEFRLSNTETGLIVSLFSWAYAASQIPSAFLVRRLGVRTMVPACMVVASAITAGIGLAGSAIGFKIGRLALGVVEAPLGVSMMTAINNWFPPREKGTAAGAFLAASKFGPVLVPPIGAMIILSLSWHWVFLLFAIPGLLFAVVWRLLVANDPAQSRFVGPEELAHIRSEDGPVGDRAAQRRRPMPRLDRLIRARPVIPISTARGVFRSWNIWGASAGYFFLQGIVGVILGWLPTYLVEVKKFAVLGVGFVSAAPFAGAVIGNILGGWISDRLFDKRRKPTMMITCASTVVMMYALTQAPDDAVLLAGLLFVTGVMLSVGYSAYAIYPSRLTAKSVFPLATAASNTGGQLGGAVLPLVTGMILDRYSWDHVFAFLAAGCVVALALLFTIIEPIEADSSETPNASI